MLEEEGADGSDWAWAESDVDPAIEGSIAHRLAARHAARGIELGETCGVLGGGEAHEVR